MRHIPTKSAANALIKSFGQSLKLKPNVLYSAQMPYLIWCDDQTQKQMDVFIDWAAENGVLWGKYEPYSGDGFGRLWFGIQ